jgi:hypothetical protein
VVDGVDGGCTDVDFPSDRVEMNAERTALFAEIDQFRAAANEIITQEVTQIHAMRDAGMDSAEILIEVIGKNMIAAKDIPPHNMAIIYSLMVVSLAECRV